MIKGLQAEGIQAEEVAHRIALENPQIPELNVARAEWIGQTEGRASVPLRLSVTRGKTANFLMRMGFGLDYKMYFAERLLKGAKGRRENANRWRLYPEIDEEGSESQEDSEMTDQAPETTPGPLYNLSLIRGI